MAWIFFSPPLQYLYYFLIELRSRFKKEYKYIYFSQLIKLKLVILSPVKIKGTLHHIIIILYYYFILFLFLLLL